MKKTIKLLFLILFMWLSFSVFYKVEAASANISIDKTTANVGDSVKVTVSIDAAAWNLNVSGAATDSIVGVNMDAENEKTTKSYTIDTSKTGQYTVTLSGDISDGQTDANTKINKSVTVNVNEKSSGGSSNNGSSSSGNTTTTKSSDATLSTLGVRPAEYDFNNFSKNKTSYSVTVPNDVDKLDVIAVASAGSKAKISISGNTNLKVGSSNNISVVVTAEDGTKKTYTIKVTKLAQEDEKEGNLIEENEENNEENKDTVENELKLESLTVKNFTLNPEFSSDTYSYTIDINMNENDVDKLELEYSANSDNANIEVIGNENLKEGENIITIMLSSEDSENTVIYQIVVNKINSSSEIANLDVNDNNTINKIKTIVISVFVGMIILIIGLIILIHFREKKLNEEFNYNDNKEKEPTKNTENKMFYENEKDDKEILNKINKNKGKHF